MKTNKKFILLWIIYGLYFFCYMTMEIEMWVLLSIWTAGLAIYLLIKEKLPSRKRIIISFALAIAVSVAYLGIHMRMGVVIANGIMAGIPTLLCCLATFSVMEKSNDIKFVSKDKKYAPLISMVIAVAVGAVLSIINFYLMKDSNIIDFKMSISRLAVCLSPAIYEEIACRTIFMAFCLYAVGGGKPTKFQQFTIWFMMCFPHTVAHNYDIISTILLCILFGFPFAVLQRKRDISSAMISHGLVDAVRFTIFGLGL